MLKYFAVAAVTLGFAALPAGAQDRFSPEALWDLKRVSAEDVHDGYLWYTVRQVDWRTEKSTAKRYRMDIRSGARTRVETYDGARIADRSERGGVWYTLTEAGLMRGGPGAKGGMQPLGRLPEDADNIRVSPDEQWVAYSREVLVKNLLGTDRHADLPKTTAQVYTDLNYRHWDTWEDGKFQHVFLQNLKTGEAKDLMAGEPYDAPGKPFGGAEDIVWRPNSRGLVYVCKKKYGKAYAQSTNTDLYYYDLGTGQTTNLTEGMKGADSEPAFRGNKLAWLSMRRDGFESDKSRLMVVSLDSSGRPGVPRDLSAGFDETTNSFRWNTDGTGVFLTAPTRGTVQLFKVRVPSNLVVRSLDVVEQVTDGKWDIAGIAGKTADGIVVTRTTINRAPEIYLVRMEDGSMEQLTDENGDAYDRYEPSRTELRMVRTTDGKDMGVWIVYPPGFDSTKKYPTLLYCQGGPQSALTQFFSFRWNFRLMAAQGYIVVAPNRRGMPGWGTAWNEAISKDWGGQPMQDYLSAIDAVAKESYVDRDRLGCVGASYGGYSVFMLAGMHEGRFKSFIAHDGLFDLKSWYGTTEELWFANWDVGGPYWGPKPPKSYRAFNPSNFVDKWDTPIMIVQGGQDFRVGIEQGLEAFQAAKLRGLKSKLVYFPDENHWVVHPQNGIAWQREFFGWLEETLK